MHIIQRMLDAVAAPGRGFPDAGANGRCDEDAACM